MTPHNEHHQSPTSSFVVSVAQFNSSSVCLHEKWQEAQLDARVGGSSRVVLHYADEKNVGLSTNTESVKLIPQLCLSFGNLYNIRSRTSKISLRDCWLQREVNLLSSPLSVETCFVHDIAYNLAVCPTERTQPRCYQHFTRVYSEWNEGRTDRSICATSAVDFQPHTWSFNES